VIIEKHLGEGVIKRNGEADIKIIREDNKEIPIFALIDI